MKKNQLLTGIIALAAMAFSLTSCDSTQGLKSSGESSSGQESTQALQAKTGPIPVLYADLKQNRLGPTDMESYYVYVSSPISVYVIVDSSYTENSDGVLVKTTIYKTIIIDANTPFRITSVGKDMISFCVCVDERDPSALITFHLASDGHYYPFLQAPLWNDGNLHIEFDGHNNQGDNVCYTTKSAKNVQLWFEPHSYRKTEVVKMRGYSKSSEGSNVTQSNFPHN